MVKPFKVNISDQIIKDIYDKVKKYPWSNIQDMDGWEHGTNYKYLKNQTAWKFINLFIVVFMSILAFYVLLDIILF